MENNTCIKCGKDTTKSYDLVTIKTMEDRGFRKTHYYQAMGDIFTATACESCVNDYVKEQLNPKKKNFLQITYTALIAFISLVVMIVVDFIPMTIFLLIFNAFIINGCIQDHHRRQQKVEMIKAQSNHQNKRMLAVELIARYLPKKRHDAQLTYIELERIMDENLEELGREFGVSQSKLLRIRHYLKQVGKEGAIKRQIEINEQAANLDVRAVKKQLRRLHKKRI